MELKWDGSHLGDVDKYYEGHYWSLYTSCAIVTLSGVKCAAHSVNSTDACLIDELKCIFKLPKLGRHTAKIQGVLVTLSPVVGPVTESREASTHRWSIFRLMLGLPCECYFYRTAAGELLDYRGGTFKDDNWDHRELEPILPQVRLHLQTIFPEIKKAADLIFVRTTIDETVRRLSSKHLNLGVHCASRIGRYLELL